jgi:hypothetical protein
MPGVVMLPDPAWGSQAYSVPDALPSITKRTDVRNSDVTNTVRHKQLSNQVKISARVLGVFEDLVKDNAIIRPTPKSYRE